MSSHTIWFATCVSLRGERAGLCRDFFFDIWSTYAKGRGHPSNVNLLTRPPLLRTPELTKPVSIIHKTHFVNLAQARASQLTKASLASGSLARGFFCNQFENPANHMAHFNTTGPELLAQTNGRIDILVLGAGTGGTISGLATYLKTYLPNLKIILADPQGSGLANKVKHNILFSETESEGTRKRHQVDSIVEGIGNNRLTANFEMGMSLIDDAISVSDAEALVMAKQLRDEGVFCGSSTAVNCVAVQKICEREGTGKVVVTILCDGGERGLGKFWDVDHEGWIDGDPFESTVDCRLGPRGRADCNQVE